mgnify:CR=1 FL=1
MTTIAEPTVAIPTELFRAIQDWLFTSLLLDRIRINFQALVPMTFGDQLTLARPIFQDVVPEGDTMAIPEEVWRIVREWPLLIERGRTSGGPLSMNDLDRLARSLELVREVA